MRHVHISGDRTSSPSCSAPRLNPFHLLAQVYDRKCVWLALGFVWVSVRQTLPYITMVDIHVHTHRQSALDWKTKPVKKRPVRVRKCLRKISWYSSRKNKKQKTKKKPKSKIIRIIAAELLHLLVDFPQTDKRSLSHSYIISIVFYLYSFKLIGFT